MRKPPVKRYHRITEAERYNLAGEYNKGRNDSSPELGFPALTFDEYISMVRSFGETMAVTLDRSPITVDDEVERCLESLDL